MSDMDPSPLTIRLAEIACEVADKLTENQRSALAYMDTFYGVGPGHLVTALGLGLEEARGILALFRKEGIAEFGTLFDEDDGMLRGRGYWLGPFGMRVKAIIEADLVPAHPHHATERVTG